MGIRAALKQSWEEQKHEMRVAGEQAKARPIAAFGLLKLTPGAIMHTGEKETHPIQGVTARMEQGSALQKRVTVSRIALTGVFAWRFKKQSGGEWWLTIEGDGFFWMEEVDHKKQKDAQAFAAKVNSQARK